MRFGKKDKPLHVEDANEECGAGCPEWEKASAGAERELKRRAQMGDHGIAGKAHGLVYGDRASTYGHPRKDFTIIAKVWTGLLQDLLQDGAELDPYRVAVMMTGLKLARLVKSPGHHDSRVDTIGYMLTMERLDEPEEVDWDKVKLVSPTLEDIRLQELARADAAAALDDDLDDELPTAATLKPYTFPFKQDASDTNVFSQKTLWAYTYKEAQAEFDQWNEDRLSELVHCPAHGRANCEACSQNPDPSRCQCGYFEATGMHWDTCPGRIRAFPASVPRNAQTRVHEVHGGDKPCWCGHGRPKFGTPEFDAKCEEIAAEQAKDWPSADSSQSPTETSNPSDGEVAVAMDILKRRQEFHDQEARMLLVRGDGINLGPQ